MSGECPFAARLAPFADGEPDPELARHLPACAACREELEGVRRLLRGVAELRPPVPKEEKFWTDFSRDVRVAVDEARARRRPLRWWIAGPALAAALAAAAFFLARREGAVAPPAEVEVAAPAPAAPRYPDVIVDEEDLDGDELDAVLVELDDEADDGSDPLDLIEDLDEAELRRVVAALDQGV